MTEVSATNSERSEHERQSITVTINDRPVAFHGHHATGDEIKAMAMEQHVAIELDFDLFEIDHDGLLKHVADGETVHLHDKLTFRAEKQRVITITVNNNFVEFHGRQATGEDIKAMALAQHVAIQPDFNLFEIRHDGSLKQISDGETIHLRDKLAFRATAPDDNSSEEDQ